MSPNIKHNNPKTPFSKRLNILIGDEKNFAFEEKCSLSNGFVLRIFKGLEPKLTALQSIILATGCNADWLITGRGEAFPDKKE
jgi:hypothetical protein